MTLKEFLLYHTKAEELCVICDPWIRATAWIDCEDLFINGLDKSLLDLSVAKDEWKILQICDRDGWIHNICVRHIYVER